MVGSDRRGDEASVSCRCGVAGATECFGDQAAWCPAQRCLLRLYYEEKGGSQDDKMAVAPSRVGIGILEASVASSRHRAAVHQSYIAMYRHVHAVARQRRTTRCTFSTSRIGSGQPRSGEPSRKDEAQKLSEETIKTYSPWIRRLAAKLPELRKPPTPAELLPLARSWWHRLQIRFKWLTIRSFRPYRTDDYSAFASLILVLNLLLLLLGTTTFLGAIIFIFNKAGMEDLVARWLSDYMTGSTGVKVVFESAVVPRWRGGMIRFENVYISRGDLAANAKALMYVVDGSEAQQRRAIALDEDDEDDERDGPAANVPENVTHFHLTIDSIDVTLSLRRWLDGKGLIREAVVKGARGVVDRSHVVPVPAPADRSLLRRQPSVGDFHLEGLQVEDLLVTVYQPNDFRPYTLSIFNADIGRLRKQWLFLDLLGAEKVTGQVDNCLFSLHRPQSISRATASFPPDQHVHSYEHESRFDTRTSRFRIDGVSIDHLQTPADTGALAWITSGRADLVADVRLPVERDDVDIGTVVKEIVGNFEKEVETAVKRAQQRERERDGTTIGGNISERPALARPALEAPSPHLPDEEDTTVVEEVSAGQSRTTKGQKVVIDMDIRFKDVKASLPMYTTDLSYVNNALSRPIVAFLNANRTLIPIKSRVELDLGEFDGSWTAFDVGLIETISQQVYAALAHHVSSQSAQSQRLHKVGIWGVQLTANAVMEALRGHLGAAH